MVEENIGDCRCIYSFEKTILTRLLEEDIERANEKIVELRKAPDSAFNEFVVREEIIAMYESPSKNLKVVLNRLSEMPTCESLKT